MEILDVKMFRSALEALLEDVDNDTDDREAVRVFLDAWDEQNKGDPDDE